MVTRILIAVNILVYIAMVISGASPIHPSPEVVMNWGGMCSTGIFNGELWRLFSSMFLHFGIMHLLLNMYALYSIGSFLEPFLGRFLFLTAYLSTGIASGLCSFFAHKDTMIISAGASGAIAGIFGIYFFILLTRLIPDHIRKNLLISAGSVLVMNIGYAFTRGANLDHAAHIGGLIWGLVCGGLLKPYLAYHQWLKKAMFAFSRVRVKWISGGVIAGATLLLIPPIFSGQKPSDTLIFSQKAQDYLVIEAKINHYIAGPNPSEMASYVLPELGKAKEIATEMSLLKLDGEIGKRRDYITKFIHLYDQILRLSYLSHSQNTPIYDYQIQKLKNELDTLNNSFSPE